MPSPSSSTSPRQSHTHKKKHVDVSNNLIADGNLFTKATFPPRSTRHPQQQAQQEQSGPRTRVESYKLGIGPDPKGGKPIMSTDTNVVESNTSINVTQKTRTNNTQRTKRNPNLVIAFDLYGTLLSTESIAEKLAEVFANEIEEFKGESSNVNNGKTEKSGSSPAREKANEVATLWRRYQLEYTWRLNSMDKYYPFSTVTRRSLHHALAEAFPSSSSSSSTATTSSRKTKKVLSSSAIQTVMSAYDSLSTFPDVNPALSALAKLQQSSSPSSSPPSPSSSSSSSSSQKRNITAVIFSNGTQRMVSNSVTKSSDLRPHYPHYHHPHHQQQQQQHLFDKLITMDDLGLRLYKPAPEVYEELATRVGKDGAVAASGAGAVSDMAECMLVSVNPFDIVGARAAGMKAVWVNRGGGPGWVDCLLEEEDDDDSDSDSDSYDHDHDHDDDDDDDDDDGEERGGNEEDEDEEEDGNEQDKEEDENYGRRKRGGSKPSQKRQERNKGKYKPTAIIPSLEDLVDVIRPEL
ncbi:hypothetical protein L228DRAFT_245545 [Xylona heveae TC161]|uniref:HAD-like protein n=1 Tax=Xylona heveae (strain CBS 132557 / TC161) TaxID=1328760 RepID=A0A165I9E6_XYLHT|nr:hypothetical protein L228DRAFT_245545 [Xylona heveae TC161]KZF24580.1 hypothetical protein L228DRAFT_245545 [Xylona heveae TC161]